MNVAFNINVPGMAGLGATLTSLIRNCSSPSELTLYFLCSNLEERDKNNIADLLLQEGATQQPIFRDYDAVARFGNLRAFHGDYSTYGKSLLPKWLSDKSVLYLDSDLIVDIDILGLRPYVGSGWPISAVVNTTVAHVYDRAFLLHKLNFSKTTPYFNAGVMIFDCEAYLQQGFDRRWDGICAAYPDEFLSPDQTVFNAMCRGQVGRLPFSYNNIWTPDRQASQLPGARSIIHLAGSPKPWDLFGPYIHGASDLWLSYTPDFWYAAYCRRTGERLKRAWRIRRSLARHLFSRVKRGA